MDMKLSLSRSDFNKCSAETFNSLFEDKNFSDVTLACADQRQINAHKIILSSGSHFFKNILLQNPHPHPLIYLKLGYSELLSIVEFIYLGQSDVEQSKIDQFLTTAKDLQVIGLISDDNNKDTNEEVGNNIEQKEKVPEKEVGLTSPLGFLERQYLEDVNNEMDRIIGKEIDEEIVGSVEQHLEETVTIFQEEIVGNSEGNLANVEDRSFIDVTEINLVDELVSTLDTEYDVKREVGVNNLPRAIKSRQEGVRHNCDLCPQYFTTISNLTYHKQKHHNTGIITCNKCDYETTKYNDLKEHIDNKHPGQKKYTCNVCGSEQICDAFLKVHMKKHYPSSHEEAPTNMKLTSHFKERQKEIQTFKTYVKGQTKGEDISEILTLCDGKELLNELFFSYFTSFMERDNRSLTKLHAEKIKSMLKLGVMVEFGLNLMDTSIFPSASGRWKNFCDQLPGQHRNKIKQ